MERNVPKLRFKGFNDEWQLSNLKKLCDINPKSKELPDKFVYIDLESIIDGVLIKKNIIELKDAPSRAQRLLNVGDVLFQTVRPYQMNNYLFEYELNYKSVASTGYAQLRCKNCISNNKFIYQALHNKKFNNKVMLRCTGTSYPAINSSELVTIPLRIPSLQEQERIANFLTKVDKIIEKQEEKVKNLENYKKGMMQKIFSQEIRFKDENGNEYPEWEEKRLGKIIVNKNKGGNALYCDYEANILLSNEYLEKKVSNITYVSNTIDVYENHILILWDGSQSGKVYTGVRGVLGSTFVSIELDKFNNNIFVYQYLNYKKNLIQEVWREGSGVPHVAKDFINNFKIFLPCLEEQVKISEVLNKIDLLQEKETNKLENLRQLKKGL
ncbi:restriction endonuclease subunit S, partial [uncultured Clostridium sp.]|uniref:restriction endonuclease subunit S n=1 Tax=uncultured Clostridium sp. TaxID=59620 RepID=UPI0027DC1745